MGGNRMSVRAIMVAMSVLLRAMNLSAVATALLDYWAPCPNSQDAVDLDKTELLLDQRSSRSCPPSPAPQGPTQGHNLFYYVSSSKLRLQ